jgi:beta-mannosidase
MHAPPEATDLRDGWEAARGEPQPHGTPVPAGLEWIPATVPGTAAAALRAAGGSTDGLDDDDWWFRTRFTAAPAGHAESVVLALDGLATVAEVHLNGRIVLASESMFLPHRLDVGGVLREDNEILICCRALTPLLAERRRPRARWRTRVAEGNLRFFRTALLGRAPGFSRGPAPVGPWRPVRLERRRGLAVESLAARGRLRGETAEVEVRGTVRVLDGDAVVAAEVHVAGQAGPLTLVPEADGLRIEGSLAVAGAARWFPHTHGDPALHDVTVQLHRASRDLVLDAGRVGFRTLAAGRADNDVEADGLDLHVNGVRVFCRGAVWTPPDPVGLTASDAELRRTLELVRDAGMNMLRVPGVGTYEDDRFHALCDELGLLVWQDLMLANFDYPTADPGFAALVDAEGRVLLDRIGSRPSTAVVCGGSEVEQQAAMFGADHRLARDELLGARLPALVAATSDAVWVPSTPCGGTLPFRPGQGIAHYFGVGAYGLPLEDARRAGVRFAAECLAFANVPDDEALAALAPVGGPAWKRGVPRDVGSSWDFDDVRDRYLRMVHGVDPAELRRGDPERYLELSRQTTGEVMAAVMNEWRRPASPCGGALVLWLRDVVPGAGWGVLDHRGVPKVAFHHLRRALAPIAVWTVDEQLGGIAVHVANDRPEPLHATLRVTLYADGERPVGEAEETLTVPAGGHVERDVEGMLGRFADASLAYRFGPPGHDLVVARLERDDALLAQATRYPAGPPQQREAAERLELDAVAETDDDGALRLTVGARRLVYGLRIHAPGLHADDDAFDIAPGERRTVRLVPDGTPAQATTITLSALNLDGRFAVPVAAEVVA